MNVTMLVTTTFGGKLLKAGDSVPVEDAVAERWVRNHIAAAGEASPLEKMTAAQLKAYAADRGIDLGDLSTKTAILAKIQEAENV